MWQPLLWCFALKEANGLTESSGKSYRSLAGNPDEWNDGYGKGENRKKALNVRSCGKLLLEIRNLMIRELGLLTQPAGTQL